LFALTEQNNLQGVCDMGMLPDRLPATRRSPIPPAANPSNNCGMPTSPNRAGARSLFTDPGAPGVRALWLCRYDPVSTAFFGEAAKSLDALELVVVQHLFMTETAQHAHVVLPLTAYRRGTGDVHQHGSPHPIAEQVLPPRPGPMTGLAQLTQLAQPWARTGPMINPPPTSWLKSGSAIPFYSGVSYENLAANMAGNGPAPSTNRSELRSSSRMDSRIGLRFKPIPRPSARVWTNAELPFALVFGHSLYYWHQNVLIKHSETLKREYRILLLDYPNGFVEINDEDARQLNIRDGQPSASLGQRHGRQHGARHPEVRSGAIFVPFFVREVERQLTEDGPNQETMVRCGWKECNHALSRHPSFRSALRSSTSAPRHEVLAPFRGRGRDTYFDTVTDANRARHPTPPPNPQYPPKRYVLPHIERLMTLKTETAPSASTHPRTPKRAIFRHPLLRRRRHSSPRPVLSRPRLPRWLLRRDARISSWSMSSAPIPEDIDDSCFCVCADTGPAARDHFDLQLMDLGDELMVVAGSPRARPARHPLFRPGPQAHIERRRRILSERAQAVQTDHELVRRHRPLRLPGQNPGQDLGGNRQPLPRMRRLHLRLPRLHLLHRHRPRHQPHRNRTRPPLGCLRAGRLHPHGRRLQPPPRRP
jgi:hypothetical protein